MITQEYNLNLIPSSVPAIVKASQYDKDSRTIEFNLYKGDEVFEIPSGSTVMVMGTKRDNTGYEYPCTFSGSKVSFDIQDQMTVLSGEHKAEIRIVNNDEILGTANFRFFIEGAGLSDDTVISETTLPIIEHIVELATEDKIMEKVDAEEGNIAIFDGNGQVQDSGMDFVDMYQIYGVKRDIETANPEWERTYLGVGKVANATHDGSSVQNDFDSIYPWSDIISVNMNNDGTINAEYGDANFKFDGSNGEVMTRIPEFYYKRFQANSEEHIQISKYPLPDFLKSEEFYIARYTTSSGVHSKSGVTSQVNTNITDFRTQARSKGSGWQQMDYHICLLQMLYLVEYANYNSQNILGNGNSQTSAQITLGGCDSLGMKSGCLSNNNGSAVIYRGVENIFGNIWQFVDGINVKDYMGYINYNPSTYAVDTFTGDYHEIGYTNANTNGNPKKLGYNENNPLIALPITVGGSATTYICDYYWQNSGNRIALFGGAWYAGAGGGFFCWNLNNASSDSGGYVGSRLLYI